jgi:hypothetical protein
LPSPLFESVVELCEPGHNLDSVQGPDHQRLAAKADVFFTSGGCGSINRTLRY